MDQISQQDCFRWISAKKDVAIAQQVLQLTQEIMSARYNLTEKDSVDLNTGTIQRGNAPKEESK
jgi:hypothetical protein